MCLSAVCLHFDQLFVDNKIFCLPEEHGLHLVKPPWLDNVLVLSSHQVTLECLVQLNQSICKFQIPHAKIVK